VQDALNNDQTVWVHAVNTIFGKREAGLVAFSQEYLRIAVGERMSMDEEFRSMPDPAGWLRDRLPQEIKTVLSRHDMRSGYAILAGNKRAVWVLPQSELRLRKPKALYGSVDVFAQL
jgi:hypothetical protein